MLTFLDGTKKCEICIKYSEESLLFLKNNLTVSKALSKLLQNYSDPSNIHYEQFLSMISIIIVDLYSNSSKPSKVFPQIIQDLELIVSEIEHSHRLYCANFSYKKFKEEARLTQLEIIKRIHEIFSSIQNQILGIPIATIIAATGFKKLEIVDRGFYVNVSILIGCLIYAFFAFVAVNNQKNTLSTIKDEVKRNKQITEERVKSDPSLEKLFNLAESRCKTQKNILDAIQIIISIFSIITVIAFIVCLLGIFKK